MLYLNFEHELVRMAIAGLDFSIRKKLANQQVRDMTQLADRIRRTNQINYDKERNKRYDKSRREKITYVEEYRDNDNFINYQHLDVNQEEDEICVTKLQPGPPYTC